MFAGKKSAQIREILISESAWEEMTCLFAPSLVSCSASIVYETERIELFCGERILVEFDNNDDDYKPTVNN